MMKYLVTVSGKDRTIKFKEEYGMAMLDRIAWETATKFAQKIYGKKGEAADLEQCYGPRLVGSARLAAIEQHRQNPRWEYEGTIAKRRFVGMGTQLTWQEIRLTIEVDKPKIKRLPKQKQEPLYLQLSIWGTSDV